MNHFSLLLNSWKQHSQQIMRKKAEYFDTHKNNRFMEFISREMQAIPCRGRHSKSRNNSRIFSNHQKAGGNHDVGDIYSQPQIIKQRKGASLLRSHSNTKYAESMDRFKKNFLQDSSLYEGARVSKSRRPCKEFAAESEITSQLENEVELEEIHYQMVRLHQNIKKMQSGH